MTLAATIVRTVLDALTCEELTEVKRRNATPEYATACASHDFIDANHYALAAFEAHYGREADLSDADEMKTLSDAMDIVTRDYLTEV